MLSSTFHDGRLISITAVDDNLTLEILAQDKTTKIKMSGLEKLRVTEFKEGNIISTLRVICPEDSSSKESTGKSLLKYAYELDEATLEHSEKFKSFLTNKLREHEKGSILILELEPSYGAYLVAIARTITEEIFSI
ncbi:hypothetical protein [Pseudomonas sp. MF6754]|uniref:hypothetical protein n=1 Tax=Pseudomonas sp. MF6754 TaxID=2797529 RepID=UPI00190AFAE3|nr:hypothetical protein [Pseudomonas sp. MF6754]MBK3453271.1 hypothetical protein [Pseudomonas sp. MF6754]